MAEMETVPESEAVDVKPESAEVAKPDENKEEHDWQDLTGDGGIVKKILVEGWGEKPVDGANVWCHYVGTLTSNGEKFDSSRDRNSEFNFPIGKGRVIKGWDIGIASMRIGEQAILRCRAEYAYGDQGQGSIPAGASLDFEVELLRWSDWDRVRSNDDLERKYIVKGEGNEYDTPQDEAQVTVSYTGMFGEDNTVFASGENVRFALNEDDRFPNGFHTAVGDMTKGERSKFRIGPNLAFGNGDPKLNIPPDTTVLYEIELHHYDNPKGNWEMSVEEHFEYAEKYKAQGNKFFKMGNFEKALAKYKKALETVEHNSDEFDAKQKLAATELRVKINGNLSLIHFKRDDNLEAMEKVNAVLTDDPINLKALTRKGQIQMRRGNYAEAKQEFNTALATDPNNPTVKKLMKLNNQKIKEYKKKQRQLAAQMFGGLKK